MQKKCNEKKSPHISMGKNVPHINGKKSPCISMKKISFLH